jgi:hypothetical protein
MMPGFALVHRPTTAERDLGQQLLPEVSETFVRCGTQPARVTGRRGVPGAGKARGGDRDEAIPFMRAAIDHLVREGQLPGWGIPATGVLVETLLDRWAESDVAVAEAAIERLASAPGDDELGIREIRLLPLRALLTWAQGPH